MESSLGHCNGRATIRCIADLGAIVADRESWPRDGRFTTDGNNALGAEDIDDTASSLRD